MDTISSEMLRGHVDTIILLSLLDCDKHTSQIKEEIEGRVEGQFELKQGTFYSCLQRIVGQGFVMEYRSSSADGKRRKFYQLTEKGKSYIDDNKDKWLFSRNVIDSLIQVPQDDAPISSVSDYESKKASESAKNADSNAQNVAPIDKIEKLGSELEQIKQQLEKINGNASSTQTSAGETTEEAEEKPSVDDLIGEERKMDVEEYLRQMQEERMELIKNRQNSTVTSPLSQTENNEKSVENIEKFDDNSDTQNNSVTEKIKLAEIEAEQKIAQLDMSKYEEKETIVPTYSNNETASQKLTETATVAEPVTISAQIVNEPIVEKPIEAQVIQPKVENANNYQQINIEQVLNEQMSKPVEVQQQQTFYQPTSSATNAETLNQQFATQAQVQQPVYTQQIVQPIVYNDFYDGETAITHDYKSVLGKLFPTAKPEKIVNEPQPIVQPTFVESQPLENDFAPVEQEKPFVAQPEVSNKASQTAYQSESYQSVDYDENYVEDAETDAYEEETNFEQNIKPNRKSLKKIKQSQIQPAIIAESELKTQPKKPTYDFSDIYALADEEGFRVRATSSSSSQKEIGKILINKLLASSSISFYFLLLVEIAILALTTRMTANVDYKPYLISAAVLAIFPAMCCLAYFIDPKKKIDSIMSFKSIIEFSFIVVLNLVLIIFVYSILINIDFTDPQKLLVYIFYPIIFVLNLPLYFFIKYLKLDNQRFFS